MTINSSNIVQSSNTNNYQNKSQYTDTLDVKSDIIKMTLQNREKMSYVDGLFLTLYGGSDEMMNDAHLKDSFKQLSRTMSQAEFAIFATYGISEKFGLKTLDNISSVTHDLFKTKENVIEYYNEKINKSLEEERTTGGDRSKMREVYSSFMKIFQDSVQREQEDSYLQLGQKKYNNG